MIDSEGFRRDGWLVVRDALGADEVALIQTAVGAVAAWAVDGGPGLHHFEQTDEGPVLARSEDFLAESQVLRELMTSGTIPAILAELFGEPAVLFKEKINYKHPGGGGFAPHQDAVAYRFVDHHISVMVPLDSATEESGCLFVAEGYENGKLPTDDRGRIAAAVAAGLPWQSVPLEAGDLLFFDSYVPHRSGTNTTTRSRRAGFLTYNAVSNGDHRERYYADKRQVFADSGGDFDGERVRISISDDFLGRPVS